MAAKDYKYQFVSPPPDDVICPLCLDIVEEPHQFTCCGQHICKKCGDKLKQQDITPQCPMCRHNESTMLLDKYFERNILNKLLIRCNEGCGQDMELGLLKNHLSQCPHVQEDCPYGCGQQYQRQYIEKHKKQCPKRPFICGYCKYQSTYEVIVNEHYPVCDKYPIICPNECSRDKMKRGMLQDHLDKCPFEMVKCEFSYVGCQEKVRRCDLAQHLSNNSIHHTALSSKMIYESLQKIIEEKDRQLTRRDEVVMEKDKQINLLLSEVRELRAENKILLSKIYNKVCDVITMTEFEHKKDNKVRWFSPPYFTHVNGYKMCFEVDLQCEDSKTSLRIDSYMLAGPYDDDLQWPFKGKVIVQLLNQLGDHNHYDYVFDYKDKEQGKRVTSGKQGRYLPTPSKYMKFDQLGFNDVDSCQYLKDNCLKFKVIVPYIYIKDIDYLFKL